jgi:hypothetical protein
LFLRGVRTHVRHHQQVYHEQSDFTCYLSVVVDGFHERSHSAHVDNREQLDQANNRHLENAKILQAEGQKHEDESSKHEDQVKAHRQLAARPKSVNAQLGIVSSFICDFLELNQSVLSLFV